MQAEIASKRKYFGRSLCTALLLNCRCLCVHLSSEKISNQKEGNTKKSRVRCCSTDYIIRCVCTDSGFSEQRTWNFSFYTPSASYQPSLWCMKICKKIFKTFVASEKSRQATLRKAREKLKTSFLDMWSERHNGNLCWSARCVRFQQGLHSAPPPLRNDVWIIGSHKFVMQPHRP